jgi:hypothetical protein
VDNETGCNGKNAWNKTIGQSFEDSICDVLLDSKGNIIVLGYTHLSAIVPLKWGGCLNSDVMVKSMEQESGKINVMLVYR